MATRGRLFGSPVPRLGSVSSLVVYLPVTCIHAASLTVHFKIAGKELAKQFASKGARLILSSRRREALITVRNEIVAANRGTVQEDDIKIVTMDLEHVDSMRECARAAITSFGKVSLHLCIMFECDGKSI